MKTIIVKGVGNVSVKPDLIVVKMRLETCNLNYDETVKLAAEKTECLNKALAVEGFKEEDVKTVDFKLATKYESRREKNGEYKDVFCGYACKHRIKIEFDFDNDRLGKVLAAISAGRITPELSIDFTVKNPAAVSEKLLKAAAANAKEKAEILCSASGVKLGELININYNWGELDVISSTDYGIEPRLLTAANEIGSIGMTPDNIHVCDSAEFSWEIK